MEERAEHRLTSRDGEILAALTHEMRRPLHAIISHADMMESELTFAPDNDATKKLGEYQSIIKREAFALLVQINQILEWTHMRAKRPQVRITNVELDAILAFTEETVRPLADENGNTVETELKGLPTAELDRDKFEHIVMNLAVNACKFTQNGTVRLAVTNSPESLVLQVIDTGIGIDASRQEDIFEPHTESSGPGDENRVRIGLGLAITKESCTCLGGTITVDSAPGQGATFTVVIPFPVQTPAAAGRRSP